MIERWPRGAQVTLGLLSSSTTGAKPYKTGRKHSEKVSCKAEGQNPPGRAGQDF